MLKILLSNDDGFDAPGLKVLYETLEGFADLFVVAPEINSSGAGLLNNNKFSYASYRTF